MACDSPAQNAIAQHAQDVDCLLHTWLDSLAGPAVASVQAIDRLVRKINAIGREYGILGSAVGVVNLTTNQFQHYKRYPEDNADSETTHDLFPYSRPTRVEQFHKLEELLTLEGLVEKNEHAVDVPKHDYWLNRLFIILREHQKLIGEVQDSMPEHYRWLRDLGPGGVPVLVEDYDSIRGAIADWVKVVTLTAFLRDLLGQRFPAGHFHTEPVSHLVLTARTLSLDISPQSFQAFIRKRTLAECIDSVVSPGDSLDRSWQRSYTNLFFNSAVGNGESADDKRDKRILREFLSTVAITEVADAVGEQIVISDETYDGLTKPAPQLLQEISESAHVPIIPYLVLLLLYKERLFHVVWPVLRSVSHEVTGHNTQVTYPAVLLATFGTNMSTWTSKEVSEYLYPFALLMRLALEPFADMVFYGKIRALQAEAEGEKKHAAAVNQAISHEFKKIVPLIPHCQPWLLEHIKDWLLAFALPGLAAIRRSNDAKFILPSLDGKQGQTYAEWLTGLTVVASQVEAVAMPGGSSLIPQSEVTFNNNAGVIAACFRVDPSLGECQPPADFAIRCTLGIAILCVFRNCIKHTATHKAFFDASGRARYGEILLNKVALTIRCGMNRAREGNRRWGEYDLVISNPNCDDLLNEAGGSSGAIRCYLDQIAHDRGIDPYPFVLPLEPIGDPPMHHTRLPSLLEKAPTALMR